MSSREGPIHTITTEDGRATLSEETYSNMTEGYSKEFNKNIP
jgi:hypothetical protein